MMKDLSRSTHRRTQRQKTAKVSADSPLQLLVQAGKALGLALGIGAALLLSGSLLLYFVPDPAPWIPVIGLAASALTALLCGYFAARFHGKNHALCGLVSGMALMALLMLLSFLFTKEASGYSALISTLIHTAFLLLSVLGALIAAQQGKNPKRKKHRR